VAALSAPVSAQRIAVIAPDETIDSVEVADRLEQLLEPRVKILDRSMSSAAWASAPPENPFNLTSEQARTLGTTIGCDMFILVRSNTLRRSAFGRAEYYESYASVYVVSTRTGLLKLWKMLQCEASKKSEAQHALMESLDGAASDIHELIKAAIRAESSETDQPPMEELPDEGTPTRPDFRAPIPFRRIKPAYTPLAAMHDIIATVEALVDLDAAGKVGRTKIVRWAGYGLDESVEKTVREMNWRPAERKGKPIPMRFLLRYNFRKMEKE
jgi:hypothetical protein